MYETKQSNDKQKTAQRGKTTSQVLGVDRKVVGQVFGVGRKLGVGQVLGVDMGEGASLQNNQAKKKRKRKRKHSPPAPSLLR